MNTNPFNFVFDLPFCHIVWILTVLLLLL